MDWAFVWFWCIQWFKFCGGSTFTWYCLVICWYHHRMPRTIHVCTVFKVGPYLKHSTSYTIIYLNRLALTMDYAWETISSQCPQEKWGAQKKLWNTQQPQRARVPEEHASSESNKLICQGGQQRRIAEALMVITWQLTYRKRTSSWDNSI